MPEKKKLVIVVTHGFDDERASVAWSIANGAINTGLDVTMFLVSSAVDWVRKGAMEGAHLNPFDPPMKDLIQKMIDNDCKILVCPPCAKVRGYDESSLVEDAVIAGAPVMLEEIAAGAASLSF